MTTSEVTIRLGSRPSPLAMTQANEAKRRIESVWAEHGVVVEIVSIASDGDRDLTTPLSEIGRGVFASALEEALAAGDIDVAVHSAKDLPVGEWADQEDQALTIVGYLPREDPRDVVCFAAGTGSLAALPPGSRIGTGSARRAAQLFALYPDLVTVPIRGNVQTRLERLQTDKLDAVVLAAAGLNRLGMQDRIGEYLPLTSAVPDPGQGAIALQVRSSDSDGWSVSVDGIELLPWTGITCAATEESVSLERAVSARLGGGCSVPTGCHVDGDVIHVFRAPSDTRPGRVTSVPIDRGALNLDAIERQLRGTVHLVGAGPGDMGLVTRKAWELVSQADVLVHDRLIPTELVDVAPSGCEIVDAGKAANNHKLTQDQTNALIVDRALQGLTVVRLKGGDPFTFGRGGEEAIACRNAGVTFTVVPGVTSGISVPAMAGIPVTHRSISNGVTLITASAGSDGSQDPNYSWLAQAEGTVVLYMGLRRVGHVAEQLIAHGAPHDRPIAVISQGATTRQRTITGSLATIEDLINDVELPSPGLIVVGDVVGLRDELSWFETLPLFGRRVVVTRVRAQASDLRDQLAVLGADVVEAPSIAIESVLSDPLTQLLAARPTTGFDDIIFTSMNGVSRFWDAMRGAGLDARWIGQARVCAIGEATTCALRERGVFPDVIAPVGRRTAVGMAETLIESTPELQGRSALVVRAETGDERLPAMLNDSGARVTVVPVYRTSSAKLSDRAAAQIPQAQLVTFASAATVRSYVSACEERGIVGPRQCVSIGPTTSEAARSAGFEVVGEAKSPSVAGLVEEIQAWASHDLALSGGTR